eukprot:TRINITY_DN1029_c0_g3_i1.p1 TRINITY_DN1029_c0_g3~~TRINITY_DN1029_c0_g3_i1.p1  ORF type:complete len:272 (-),score=29.50 TRINITY_DN1029_c0_g3_i1:927-1742(-)
MRFKATLIDHKALLEVLEVLEKLGSTCLVHLSTDTIRLCMNSDRTSGEQVFFESPVQYLFQDFKIESMNNNEIPFLANISNLAVATKSCTSATKIVVKLTKKNNRPCLTFDIACETVKIVQDVPILLQPAAIIQDYQEPSVPAPEVKFRMPNMKLLKSVVERMKSVGSSILTLTASTNGQAVFQVEEGSVVSIKTFFKGLDLKEKDEQSDPEAKTAAGRMDIKKFANILNSRSLSATHFIGCISEEHAFILYVKLKLGGTVTFYVPLLASE